jgi:two-component system, LytTR family, sensor kinase
VLSDINNDDICIGKIKMQGKINILSNSRLSVLLHIIAWSIIIIIPTYLLNTNSDGSMPFPYSIYFNLAIYGLLFYVNYLWLMPRFFFKGRRTTYFLAVLALLIITSTSLVIIEENLNFNRLPPKDMMKFPGGMPNGREEIRPPMREFKISTYVSTSILILGFSLGLKMVEKMSRDEKEKKELEKEKLNSELAFLKNQVSPHFFFNTLNNIYSLIDIDAGSAKESVLKLSKLMRYLLYESEKGESKLSEELAFLNNYIDLMKLRLNNKVRLTLDFPSDYNDISIPPLLFVPFVENAFKHGISYRSPSFIEIGIQVSEARIHFITRNSIGKSSHMDEKKYSGIGLENVRKRLSLLFPHRHRLTINEKDDVFEVDLLLELSHRNEKG